MSSYCFSSSTDVSDAGPNCRTTGEGGTHPFASERGVDTGRWNALGSQRGLLLLVLRAPTVPLDLGPAGQPYVTEFALEGLFIFLTVADGLRDDAVLAAKIPLPARIRVRGVQDVNSGPRKVLGTSGDSWASRLALAASRPLQEVRKVAVFADPALRDPLLMCDGFRFPRKLFPTPLALGSVLLTICLDARSAAGVITFR